MLSKIPIYWLNLNRSRERKQYFENMLEENNITNHNRVEAIDGNNISKIDYNIKNDITVYELACTLSHIKAIQTAYSNNCEYAIILEDDCNFEYIKYQKHSIKELIDMMNSTHINWEILQLSMCNRKDQNERIKNNNNYIIKGNRCCATAYLINKRGMMKFNKISNNISQSDSFLYKTCNTYYLTKPYLIYHYSKDIVSTIHNQGINSNQTQYKREDENKLFWDNYYIK